MTEPTSAAPDPVPDAVLDDLRDRLRRHRTVPVATSLVAGDGVDPAVLAALLAHWSDGYYWRAL